MLAKGLSRQASRITSRRPLGALERLEHTVERDGLVLDVEVADELGVRRHQIIGAVDLDAVPGIIDHRDIGIARGLGEFADDAAQLDDAEVALIVDGVEAGLLEQRRHRVGIARGIGERGAPADIWTCR